MPPKDAAQPEGGAEPLGPVPAAYIDNRKVLLIDRNHKQRCVFSRAFFAQSLSHGYKHTQPEIGMQEGIDHKQTLHSHATMFSTTNRVFEVALCAAYPNNISRSPSPSNS